jgi:hypothetical protein
MKDLTAIANFSAGRSGAKTPGGSFPTNLTSYPGALSIGDVGQGLKYINEGISGAVNSFKNKKPKATATAPSLNSQALQQATGGLDWDCPRFG